MRYRLFAAAVLIAAVMMICGCKAVPEPAGRVRAQDGVVLPEWAPRNPSPEFLRAAKILRSIPMKTIINADIYDPVKQSVTARYLRTLPRGYELFGTLSDEQVKRLLADGEARIPFSKLSAQQRIMLDRWFEAYAKAMKGYPDRYLDYRAILFRTGARKDLSNTDFGFKLGDKFHRTERMVHICFWIRQGTGKTAEVLSMLAQLPPPTRPRPGEASKRGAPR